MAATKAPSGLAIARDGSKFTFSWKIANGKYGAGQQLQWRVKVGNKWKDWTSVSIGKTVTKKTVTVSANSYYPNKSNDKNKPKLASVQFRVRGKRENENSKKYDWSGWTDKTFDVKVPDLPTLNVKLNTNVTNECTFSWKADNSNKAVKWFTDVQWETMLVKDSSESDGSKLKWNSSKTDYHTGTGNASGSQTYTENTSRLATGSWTRWFRVRARGPQGASQKDGESTWRYARHVYASPRQAAIVGKPEAKENNAGGYDVTVKWNVENTLANPIDSVTVQYKFAVPAEGVTCPAGDSGWTDANTSKDVVKKEDAAAFKVDGRTDDDECLWVRVNTVHDKNTTYGKGTLAKTGYLANPSNVSVEPNPGTFQATITAHDNSDVPDSFLVIKYRRSEKPGEDYDIGYIPHGETSTVVQCPDWTGDGEVAFGVYACVGTATKQSREDGSDAYAINKKMVSKETVWKGGNVPMAPKDVAVSATDLSGTVRVTWGWSWPEADRAVLSWADHADAWESTDEPQTYEVDRMYAAAWNISGLDIGKTWYVRVRLAKGETYGPWSSAVDINLSSAPCKPQLVLSRSIVRLEESFTASWAYVSIDTTGQAYAKICEATIENGEIVYGDEVARVETAQHIDLNFGDRWETGNTYLLCLQVRSASGNDSEWSDPVAITVAEPLEVNIATTSLETITIVADDETSETREVLSLTRMPLEITLDSMDSGNITTVVIERAEDYHVDRPDETEFNGYAEETITVYSPDGDNPMAISNGDLYGSLDDGAAYNLIVTVQDGFGQSAVARIDGFEVHWEEQALIPDARCILYDSVVRITPIAPEDAQAGAVCDIYRLSADKPVLIVAGAEFGTIYVDPYPAIAGGHRIVYRTVNGDYITANNEMAWIDIEDGFYADYMIIDFNGDQIGLPYNLKLSNSWKKDFTETKYLGGSIQGDWNPAVSRSLSVNTTTITLYDEDKIDAMRRLAVYPGICHVRTPDGSSFDADIQVSESRSFQTGGKKVDFTLSITRVDPEGLDGMTLEEWENGLE